MSLSQLTFRRSTALSAGRHVPPSLRVPCLRSSKCRLIARVAAAPAGELDVSDDVASEGAASPAAVAVDAQEPAAGMGTPAFERLGVDAMFLPALAAQGILAPSPIQEAAVPAVLAGGNAAIQSYTGSGKTLAYLLPALTLAFRRAEALYKTSGGAPVGVQVLVVAPGQELAMQICRVAKELLGDQLRQAVQQCIGGANGARQRDNIALHKPLMVVGTPGRLAEMVRKGVLLLHHTPLLILDEADQLLADNFREDLSHIAEHCGRKVAEGRQTVLVSATLSQSVLTKFSKWCPEPKFVTSGGAPMLDPLGSSSEAAGEGSNKPGWGWGVTGWEGPASAVVPKTQGTMGGAEGADLMPTMPPTLRHLFVVTPARHRVDSMRRVLYALGATRVLGFMNWQQRLQDAKHKLRASKIKVEELHGELSKMERQNVLESFRRGGFPLLLVNDVAARGLDLPEIDVVVNMELPSNAAHYAHRAGRTGRMGSLGTVVSLVTPEERFVVERLSTKLGVPIQEVHLANGEMVEGPAPPRPAKKASRKQPAQEAAAGAAASPAADGSSSSSTTAAADAPTSSSSSSSAKEAWREAFKGIPGLKPGEDETEIVDLEDQLEVEGDEGPEEFRSRYLAELQSELEELQEEEGSSSDSNGSSRSSAGGRGAAGRTRGRRGAGKGLRLSSDAKQALKELQALFEGEGSEGGAQEGSKRAAPAAGAGAAAGKGPRRSRQKSR